MTLLTGWADSGGAAALGKPEGTAGPPPANGGLAGTWLRQIQQWKEEAEPEDRAKMNEFLLAVEARWIWRKLTADSPEPDAGGKS